jgi:anhydro-N-acetylmuramic acid kinase
VFSHREHQRVIVNIGGIANITMLPIDGQGVMGFDSGPGNGLMDDWAQAHMGTTHDSEGAWARSGKVDAALLQNLSSDAYFERPPPKSTGREYFNYRWLQERLTRHPVAPASADVQATLLELTARSIAEAIGRFAPGTQEVYCCGGGVKNAALMETLRAALHPCPVATTAILGIPPDAVEAVMCAWLAKQRLTMQPGNVPAVTGARSPAILGGVYLPPV